MRDELLAKSPVDVAAALIEDSPRGQLLRETGPVFGKGPRSARAPTTSPSPN
jgi:hypothetical protein